MKICLINNLYKPYSRGGAEKIVEILEEGLRNKGHEVFVISSTENFPINLCWYRDLDKHGIIFRLLWHIIDTFNLHSFFAIKKILKKERPNIVWTHNLKGLGYLTPLAIKQSGIKHIHTLHDVQLVVPSGLIVKGEENSLEQKIFLRSWYEKICKYLFGSPDIVVSPSYWLMKFYEEKGFFKKSEKLVMPNPVNVISRDCRVASLRYAPRNDKYLDVLFLGQIEMHKGVIFAIKSLKNLKINFRLHIVGDGSKIKKIKGLVEDDERFVIYGRREGKDLEKIWEKIDLTIFPSNVYENYPTVVLESLTYGVPVIASSVGGTREILTKTFLFEPNNEKEFLERVWWIIKNPIKTKCFVRKKQDEIKEHTIEKYLNKIL